MRVIKVGFAYAVILAMASLVSACSEGQQGIETGALSGGLLPAGPGETVSLSGEMTFWMYEGSAGCYGTLVTGGQEVQLWVDADSCGEREYQEGESASVEVTFNPDNQYGPGKTYTITRFQ